jgi:anti-sigma factor RsiW
VSPSELHQVEAWFSTHSEGGEPLKVPHFDRLAGAGVHLEVARLSLAMVGPERWERTAHLVYRFQESKQRLTVVAFQGSPEALSEGDVRVIEGVEVKVIERGSLRVASYRRGGLSYMLTSDLHTDELLKLIGADLKSAREGLHAQ